VAFGYVKYSWVLNLVALGCNAFLSSDKLAWRVLEIQATNTADGLTQ